MWLCHHNLRHHSLASLQLACLHLFSHKSCAATVSPIPARSPHPQQSTLPLSLPAITPHQCRHRPWGALGAGHLMNRMMSAQCVVKNQSTVCCTHVDTCACVSIALLLSNKTRVGSVPSVDKPSVMSSRSTAHDQEYELAVSSGWGFVCLQPQSPAPPFFVLKKSSCRQFFVRRLHIEAEIQQAVICVKQTALLSCVVHSLSLLVSLLERRLKHVDLCVQPAKQRGKTETRLGETS